VALTRTGVFVLKVLPMLPSRPLDALLERPIVETLEYRTLAGEAQGDVYRPRGPGPHPGIVVCLGVVPFGVDHPQVPRLGEALAHAGFAALLYWSPAMRDFRLDPEDIDSIAMAYERLTCQRYVNPRRSGLFGTCVGGSFALMAAAHALIRERVAFVGAFAPYASLDSLARSIVTSTVTGDTEEVSWKVDPLTRKVFVHSITAPLHSTEAEALRRAFENGASGALVAGLSPEGRAVQDLLGASDGCAAAAAMQRLPEEMRRALRTMSPLTHVRAIHAPVVTISHDRDDAVIPVQESRSLMRALRGRRGVHYTEFAMFEHVDPTKRKLSPLRMLWQLSKLFRWLLTVFRAAAH